METTLELPAKRPNEGVFDSGSGSGEGSREEASKKAMTEPGSDHDGPHFERFDECLEYFGGDELNAGNYWQEYKDELRKKCKLLDLQYFQTYTRQLEPDKANRLKFDDRPWVMRPTPGCYDDYQRLFLYDPYGDDRFSYYYCSLETDTSFLQLYDKLKLILEKSSRRSIRDIRELMEQEQLSKNYNIHDPSLLDSALQDSRSWIVQEDLKKRIIPVFTKLFHETVINERCIDEVVKDITEHDKEMHADCKRFIQPASKGTFGNTVLILDELKKYITAKTEGKSFNDLSIEDLVRDFFREDPPTFGVYAYSTYVEKKMQLAKKLGIIDRP